MKISTLNKCVFQNGPGFKGLGNKFKKVPAY